MAATALLAACLTGCGGGEEPQAQPQAAAPRPATPAATPTAPAASVAATGNATVRGTVTGPAPAATLKPIKMSADAYCVKAHEHPVVPQRGAIGPDGRVRWAFVYVKAGLEGRAYPTPDAAVRLDQVGCMFEPHVFGVQTGQPIAIHNSDHTTHNVHAKAKVNKAFNLGHPPVPGLVHTKRFSKPEVMVRIKCDVHPWMSSYVGVLPHPYYAVTGADGTYSLSGLPAGTYTIAAWHESLGEHEAQVTVPGDGETTLDLTFPAS